MSADARIFDVAPTDENLWIVLVDGLPLGGFPERNQAVEIATILALRHRPSRLLTRSENGEIEAITPFEVESRRASEETALILLSDDDFKIS